MYIYNRINSFISIYIISVMCAMLAVSCAHAAPLKGNPGSTDRIDWCDSKLAKCIKEANIDCEEQYLGTTQISLCKASEVTVCKNTYGSTSDCMTRDLVTHDSAIINPATPGTEMAPTDPIVHDHRSPKIDRNSQAEIVAPNNRTGTVRVKRTRPSSSPTVNAPAPVVTDHR